VCFCFSWYSSCGSLALSVAVLRSCLIVLICFYFFFFFLLGFFFGLGVSFTFVSLLLAILQWCVFCVFFPAVVLFLWLALCFCVLAFFGFWGMFLPYFIFFLCLFLFLWCFLFFFVLFFIFLIVFNDLLGLFLF